MDDGLKIGELVVSIKGHDEGRIYLVVDKSGEFAFLVDGTYRLINNPKKKRVKHLKSLHTELNAYAEKYKQNKLYDYEIATALKNLMGNLHKF